MSEVTSNIVSCGSFLLRPSGAHYGLHAAAYVMLQGSWRGVGVYFLPPRPDISSHTAMLLYKRCIRAHTPSVQCLTPFCSDQGASHEETAP